MNKTCRSAAVTLATLFAGAFVLGCSVIPGVGNDVDVSHHVNVGASENVTINEQTWEAEQQPSSDTPWTVEGGDAISYEESFDVRGTGFDKLYQTGRNGLDSISFDLPNGVYMVQLHFAETSPDIQEAGKRTFDVSVEDVTVLSGYDPYASAGGHRTASIQTIDNVQVKDGSLDITFSEKNGSPLLHGIKVQSK